MPVEGMGQPGKTALPLSVRQMLADELALIPGLDCSVVQTAFYVATYSPRPPGLFLRREPLPEPVRTPTWGEGEVRSRLALWHRNLAEGCTLWGAFRDDRLVGFALVSQPQADRTVVLHSLWVDAGHRGQGAGTALLMTAERQARRLGAPALSLRTLLTNAVAVGFYLRRGYRVVQLADRTVVAEQHPEVRFAKPLR